MKIALERLKAGKRKYSTALSLGGYMEALKKGRKDPRQKISPHEIRKELLFIKPIIKSHRSCLSLKNKTSKR